MRTMRELIWLTQLGLSIVCPLLLSVLGAVWLRNRFDLGNWVIFLGIALGFAGAGSAGVAFARDVKFLNQPPPGASKEKQKEENPPLSFNEHD